MSENRTATITRKTRETNIVVSVDLDGSGTAEVTTGIGFLDHMLEALGCHACFDLSLQCDGDLEIDDHHTSEDCGLAIGQAIDAALGDRRGIARFSTAFAPLDEALARTVIDLSGRPCAVVNLGLKREAIGALACENVSHVMQSMAMTLRAAVHVDVLRGENDHHRAEAAFKSLALALRAAVARDARRGSDIPSTKGAL